MEEQANYIQRIEIHRLWDRFNIAWDLRPDVNILSGINGVGKTTILNRSVHYLEELSGEIKNGEIEGVRITFDRPDATYIPYDVIRSYDRPLIMGDFTARMADPNVKSELDWQLYLLQRRYLDYQDGERLLPYKLSSGEKQMLIILLTVLVRDNAHCVLFMDEPEASLHIEWQQKLISMIRELNPNVQLILTTHSPAVIMEGWLDAVTEVDEISTVIR